MDRLGTVIFVVTLVVLIAVPTIVLAQGDTRFEVELELGPVWQSRNTVQIPNDDTGTRFSLKDLVGTGPWPAGRASFTWNLNQRHGLRLLAAPLSYTETGMFAQPVSFAGETYLANVPTEATYQFNSWRASYRYRLKDGQRWRLWIGFTAKVRDAKIELVQNGTSSRDTDVGFVPLFHLAADYRLGDRWHVLFDFDGLAGGPGRAFDGAVKLGYDVNERWSLAAGYRTIEGGADTDDVYNFAWLHHAVVSGVVRF